LAKSIIYFLVTNSLHQDQRLHKICESLASNAYQVTLVGVKKQAPIFSSENFNCYSLPTWFKKGPLFYLEINLKFFFFLLFKNFDAVVANDLDTVLAGSAIRILRRKKLFIDLHEYFTEVPELEHKSAKKFIWNVVGNLCVGRNSINYTVNDSLANLFSQKYGVQFASIYNYPKATSETVAIRADSIMELVYIGMINKGRGLKESIIAIRTLPFVKLTIYGDGDEYEEVQTMVHDLGLANRVTIKGFISYTSIKNTLSKFDLGLNLLDRSSANYYYSSSNKYFDYIMAGIPCLSMAFPEYLNFNQQHETSILIDQCTPGEIAKAIQRLNKDKELHAFLRANCARAREKWTWNSQEPKLLEIYNAQF